MFKIIVKTQGSMSIYEAFSHRFWVAYAHLKQTICIPPELERTRSNPLMIYVIEFYGASASVDDAMVETVTVDDNDDYRIVQDRRGNEYVVVLRGDSWVPV